MKEIEDYIWFSVIRKSDGKEHNVKYATDNISEAQGRIKRDINYSGEVWCTKVTNLNIAYRLKKDEIKSYKLATHEHIRKRREWFLKHMSN